MQALLALLPCVVVIAAVLGRGWSGLAAAAASLAATVALVGLGTFRVATGGMLAEALVDATALTALVSATLVPGVLFIEATRRLGAPQAIAHVVALLRLPTPQAAVLIAVGLGVLVESLTGMGVSLLLTVPMLVALLPRGAAIAVALVGMSLMPWGALALAGTLGATLAKIEPGRFGVDVWMFSGAVAALLPALATLLAGGRTRDDMAIAVLCGAVLWAATGMATIVFGMPLAGVAGGLSILVLLGVRAERSKALSAALKARALRPYAVLILAVTLQTLAVQLLARRGLAPTVSTGRVDLAVLTSPGIALTVATVISAWMACDARLVRDVALRSWRAVASVALFMLTARTLVSAGGIDALTAALKSFGATGALMAVTGLGAVGGFVTGSGVTGNALFLPSAVATGAAMGDRDLYSAICSAAAGHVALASVPVAALLLTALTERTAADDRSALTWGLLLAGCHLTVLVGIGLAWLALQPK